MAAEHATNTTTKADLEHYFEISMVVAPRTWMVSTSHQQHLNTHPLDVAEDGELAGGQGANHEQTSAEAGEAAAEAELAADLEQPAGGALAGRALGLVDLAQHRVGRL